MPEARPAGDASAGRAPRVTPALNNDVSPAGPPAGGSPERTLDLLRRAQVGDRHALEQLLARTMPRLSRWARGRLPRRARGLEDTDDLVQEAVVHALAHLGSFEPQHEGALQAYLRQAVVNRVRNNLRGAARRPPGSSLPEDPRENGPSPFDEVVGAETMTRYEAGLARLSASDRELIVLRVELRHDYATIAALTGRAAAESARVAVGRALARLAREMGDGR